MAHTVPTCEPQSLTLGFTWAWDARYAAYPPSEGWTLAYDFNNGAAPFTVTAATSASGDVYEVRQIPATHAARAPGNYRLTGYVTNAAGEKYPVYDGRVELVALGQKGKARQTLEVVEAALSGRLTADVESYAIAGREVKKIPIAELRVLRGQLEYEVWCEENPGASLPAHAVRFVAPR